MDRPTRDYILRLPSHDYSGDGWYFVTVCTAGRRHLFARAVAGELVPSRAGEIVADVWCRIPQVNARVTLDLFVVMPDHFHGILIIRDNIRRESSGNLSNIVGTFKSVASREIRRQMPSVGPVWQRGFHDRVIRSTKELHRIQEFIRSNPDRW